MDTIKEFENTQKLWLILIMTSGVIAVFLALGSPYDRYKYALSITLGLASIATAILYWRYSALPKIQAARRLESYCDSIIYWPRKHSFICRKGDIIYCYNYASSMYYKIILNKIEKSFKIKIFTPLDYYCFKMLGGKIERKNRTNIYVGEIEALSEKMGIIIRGKGKVLYSENAEVLEKVNGDDPI